MATPKLATGSSSNRPAATVATIAATVTGTWIVRAAASERLSASAICDAGPMFNWLTMSARAEPPRRKLT